MCPDICFLLKAKSCLILEQHKQAAVGFCSWESLRKEPRCLETDGSRLLTGEMSACPPGAELLLRLHYTARLFALQKCTFAIIYKRLHFWVVDKNAFFLKTCNDNKLIYKPAVHRGAVTIFSIAPRYANMAEWRRLSVYQLEAPFWDSWLLR